MKRGFLFLVAVFATACADDNLGIIPPVGSVDGYLCNPTDDSLAQSADVTAAAPSGTVSTTTDATGFFTLRGISAGPQTLTVTGMGFTDSVAVTVVEDETTRLPDPSCLVGATGRIEGRICANETGIGSGMGYWLADARVFVQIGTDVYETTTDAQGNFVLDGVPAGMHTLRVEKGSFEASMMVDVLPCDTTCSMSQITMLSNVCIEPSTRMAVVTGIFDSVETVLTDLGFGIGSCSPTNVTGCPGTLDPMGTITLFEGTTAQYVTELLLDPVRLDEFEIIFFNCGLSEDWFLSAPPAAKTNLKDWVEAGGSIYVSDWAYEILRETDSFGGLLDFSGNDSTPRAAKTGIITPMQSAGILDATLSTVIGSATVQLVYDKGDWVQLAVNQGVSVEVLVSADISVDTDDDQMADATWMGAPVLVSVPAGAGRIIYTTFHTHQQASADMQAILQHIIFEL